MPRAVKRLTSACSGRRYAPPLMLSVRPHEVFLAS
jgi:hypothetical protein